MASLHKLLTQEGFDSKKPRKPRKTVKFKEEDSIALPIFICHDRKSFDSSRQKSEKAFSLKSSSVSSFKRGNSGSEKSDARPRSLDISRREEPAIDDVAVKAMVSILSGYIGRYLRDKDFRERINEKCRSCFLKRKKQTSENDVIIEQGIRTIEGLVANQDVKKELDLETLQNSIKLFNLFASTDSPLSACAHLYLSIIYKIAKNDKISARYLLQVFIESPFLARRHLLPELWEHLFLPHLLHVKIWYTQELETLSSSEYVDQKRINSLNEQYNGLMDNGTTQFALYYKEWLKIGGQAPPIPSVHLPSKPSHARSRRRSSSSHNSHHSVSNKSLYQEVFSVNTKGRSMDLDNKYETLENLWEFKKHDKIYRAEEISHIEKKVSSRRRSSSHIIQKTEVWPESQRPDYFRFLACRVKPNEFLVHESYVDNNEKIKHDEEIQLVELNEMNRAIATICSSESLSECEMAIRAVSDIWLNSNLIIENSLSEVSVLQGMMEILLVSNDDEVLELAISILAELATKSEINRQNILHSDPHLEVSLRLLENSYLFLKAASLLFLMKPKAEQMVSMEWVPLVLRVLEFGDQSQTLFSVRCNPHEAAYYFLDQLLTGFDEDRNLENTRQIISLGGLRLFVKRMDFGDTSEKNNVSSILHYCIHADGSCRHYLAKHLKIENIVSLLVVGKYTNSHKHAFVLLTELLCLSRTKPRKDILTELMKGWDCLNTMQILLLHLQKVQPEEQPMIAVVLLQLDLMGDILNYSIYREEAIDTLVKALDCRVLDVKVQEQLARALFILAGHFSYNGDTEIEKWLLRKAGYDLNMENSLRGKDISVDGNLQLNEEDKSKENWKKRAAQVLLTSGHRRLIVALSDAISNSIPCLARASLVTVCWMTDALNSMEEEKDLQLTASSKLVPPLIDCLNNSTIIEERILASFTLLGLAKSTGYICNLSWLEMDVLSCLHELSHVTWTAKELISLSLNN